MAKADAGGRRRAGVPLPQERRYDGQLQECVGAPAEGRRHRGLPVARHAARLRQPAGHGRRRPQHRQGVAGARRPEDDAAVRAPGAGGEGPCGGGAG